MRVYEIQKGCQSVEGLAEAARPQPVPEAGQILVRMRAASLNYRDQAIIAGKYFGGVTAQNTIALSDGAGEVAAIGERVTRFKIGDRVAGTFFRGWIDGPPAGQYAALGSAPIDGVLAEYCIFEQTDAVAIPPNLSFEEAATLPCAAVTAWNALMVVCKVQAGETVLILGSGGVSIFALQFARTAGARVIMTSSSDAKLERGRQLGVADVINYRRTPEWETEVLKLTAGRGVDHVIEVGGPGTLGKSMQAVGYAGHIALIGVLAGFQGDTNPHPVMRKGANIHGIFVGSRAMFEKMNAAIETNRIKPVIDKVFPFEQTRDAFLYQQSGAHFGKVVISI
jgi:NADPH:quinone reductase-like Zn-dependent oxidoreductase